VTPLLMLLSQNFYVHQHRSDLVPLRSRLFQLKEAEMAFEARQLRVQLPCGPVTVIEAERHDAEVTARRLTGWGKLAFPRADDDCSDCGSGTGCGFCSGGTKDRLADLCRASDPLDVRVVVDARVLPILQEQLKAQLKEVEEAQQALARMTGKAAQP